MAFSFQVLFLLTLVLVFPVSQGSPCIKSLFNFGDEFSDAGNWLLEFPDHLDDILPSPRNLPYGQTYFNKPTGRYSDGRLIVDFVAEALGLPLPPPYLEAEQGFGELRLPFLSRPYTGGVLKYRQGANFAGFKATALDRSYFNRTWPIGTTNSLRPQIQQFKKLLSSVSHQNNPVLLEILQSSLIFVGEIGWSDYEWALWKYKFDIDRSKTVVPDVIAVIVETINELVELGAVELMVPGLFPIGCLPVIYGDYQVRGYTPPEGYDSRGCIKQFNKFAEYHNDKLQDALQGLRQLHPQANIVYVDYYHSLLRIYDNPTNYGFSSDMLMNVCCGTTSDSSTEARLYNFDESIAYCGQDYVCPDPNLYVSWDGHHLTEAAHRVIASNMLSGNSTYPSVNLLVRICHQHTPASSAHAQLPYISYSSSFPLLPSFLFCLMALLLSCTVIS